MLSWMRGESFFLFSSLLILPIFMLLSKLFSIFTLSIPSTSSMVYVFFGNPIDFLREAVSLV